MKDSGTKKRKTALITGITGQDGSYLSELLLAKGYRIVGLVSAQHPVVENNLAAIRDRLILEPGDLTDRSSLERVLRKYRPDEIYNLAALTYVPTSWQQPELVGQVNALGVARLLSLLRQVVPESRFYQASSSKMFGDPEVSPQDETTPFRPLDPYAAAKVYAHNLTVAYRDQFHLFAIGGILYNHESSRRGHRFVTRKISTGAVLIKHGRLDKLALGSLDAQEDWGFAGDYVEAIYLMVQADQPRDYLVASGELHSVREICQIAFDQLGLAYENYVSEDKRFLRVSRKKPLVGNAERIRKELGWRPKVNFEELIKMMVAEDLKRYTAGNLYPNELKY